MNCRLPQVGIFLAIVVTAVIAGCMPQQPIYLFEKNSDDYYIGQAQEIEYPDVASDQLPDVVDAVRPLSLENMDPDQMWDLTLEEALHTALANSKVMRSLGGSASLLADSVTPLGNPEFLPTVYDPALQEYWIESALAEFDTTFLASVGWNKNALPRNLNLGLYSPVLKQDGASANAELRKWNPTGGWVYARHTVDYLNEYSRNTTRLYDADYQTGISIGFEQPLMQGFGVQFNRIAGSAGKMGASYASATSMRNNGFVPGNANGVVISRINTDISLAQFEEGVRNLVREVEQAYWELYLGYRKLDTMRTGRDKALEFLKNMIADFKSGRQTATASDVAQAEEQYYLFNSSVQSSLHLLYRIESKLRYLMGIAATDGRLIRPSDEAHTARVEFDWADIKCEALARRVELRRLKWNIKKAEMQLIAAKNYLLPTLNVYGTYRWDGLGAKLIEPYGGTGNILDSQSNAYQSLTGGDFQSWEMGVKLEIPLGFHKATSGVRTAQLQLAKDRSLLQEAELTVVHQVTDSMRAVEDQYELARANYNRLLAARRQVKAVAEARQQGKETVNVLLNAHQQLAQAESNYFDSLVRYTQAIADVEYHKGSLLEYNNVYLAEGAWPGKAYFDAKRRARSRSAAMYMDYGYTRPGVISRGPYAQHAGREYVGEGEMIYEGEYESSMPTPADPGRGSAIDSELSLPVEIEESVESVPTPAPTSRSRQSSRPAVHRISRSQPAAQPRLKMSDLARSHDQSNESNDGWTAAPMPGAAPTVQRRTVAARLTEERRQAEARRQTSARPAVTMQPVEQPSSVRMVSYEEPVAQPQRSEPSQPTMRMRPQGNSSTINFQSSSTNVTQANVSKASASTHSSDRSATEWTAIRN